MTQIIPGNTTPERRIQTAGASFSQGINGGSRRAAVWVWILLVLAMAFPTVGHAEILNRSTKDTLTPVELNQGDTLQFQLLDGRISRITVESTEAEVRLTNLDTLKEGFEGGGTVYRMTCDLTIDGHPLRLHRYNPVQQSFYEPIIVNGLRIWFDGVRNINDFLNNNHGAGLPRTDLRLAVQDLTLPISPEELGPWYPNAGNYIDVVDSYNADDVWMGPYFGSDLHGGLDINMPNGTPLWSPMDVDNQLLFNSVERGSNNNRWRAERSWPNGERWVIQAHHLVRLLIPEGTPLEKGTHYAETAGVYIGAHAHTHFFFRIGPDNDEALLDPWILFWQIFENNRERAREIRANMAPIGPAETGVPVRFSSEGSRPGPSGVQLEYRWTFGDGAGSSQPDPEHIFTRSGIYPVTLTVDDGTNRADFTQHITVDGPDITEAVSLSMFSEDEVSFHLIPAGTMKIYKGQQPRMPQTLYYTAWTQSEVSSRTVRFTNIGGGSLPPPEVSIEYRNGNNWASILRLPRLDPGSDRFRITVNPEALRGDRYGSYFADITVAYPGEVNESQTFSVRVDMLRDKDKPTGTVLVDNDDPACLVSPWFWLSHRFHRHFPDLWRAGHGDGYLISGAPGGKGQYVRFQPALLGGSYEVTLSGDTPVELYGDSSDVSAFSVHVKHRNGEETFWVEPSQSRVIGTFEFSEGNEGYVEIRAEGAQGLVVADAVRFAQASSTSGTWAGFPTDSSGTWADTGSWLGWLYPDEPWVFSINDNGWFYLTEGSIQPSGSWLYRPR